MLEVRLIGKFDVRFKGDPIDLSTRASQSLFAYLILTAGTLHRREKLAGIFWPDVSEKKARTSLRQELWRIRKVFSTKTDTEYLVADDIAVSFNARSVYWLDVDVLTKLGDQASARELVDGLALYRGELLPGFYDEWVTEQRAHLHNLYEKRMEQLLDLLEAEQRWQDMQEWAEIWISFSPASEPAYQRLMLAYRALGDYAKVTSTFERCAQALRELDLEPSEQTRTFLVRRKRSLNVPIPMTSFIGRETELKEIADLLSRSRLLTLTGSGGVGKTRLAIQAVADLLERFPDGIWFLDLAPLSDPTLIPNILANLLGLQESGDRRLSITDQLINFFRSRTSLVIFDNCEHLIEACARLVHTLLTSCEQLSILATSREPLRVAGEIPHRVPSLDVPSVGENPGSAVVMRNESVRLFAERAAMDLPAFKLDPHNVHTIAQICHRLDGIPLAIELAAARVPILSVQQILKRLDDRFNLLAGGLRSSLPRHQTLRATIEWSYDLLVPKERILFRRLAVFSRSWTLDAAEAVCSGDGILRNEILDLISQLVNKSLVVADLSENKTHPSIEDPVRYRRLEIIREFAREKLIQATEAGRLMDRHLDYFLQKTEEIEPYLQGPEQATWLDVLDEDLDDIRLALEWSIASQKEEQALRLFSAMGWYWFIRCRFREGEEWFRRIQTFIENTSKRMRAKVLRSASWLYYAKDDFITTLQMHAQCLELYRGLEDEREVSTSLQFMGVMQFNMGQMAEAETSFQSSLEISRRLDNKAAMPRALMHLGHFAQKNGDTDAARRYFEESVSIGREVGEGHLMMMMLGNMGNFAYEQKYYHLAREYYQEALQIGIRLKNKRTIAEELLNFAHILNAEGRYSESARLQGFTESLFTESETLTESHLAAIRGAAGLPKKHLGDRAYQTEYDIGKSLPLDQVVGIALKIQA